MNIGFVTDTNILKKREGELIKESKFFDNTNFFIDYIDSLEKTSCTDRLMYFMPNIIMEELYYQKLRAFNEIYASIYKNYQDVSYGLKGELPICKIEEVLNMEKEEYKKKIKVLELPYNKTIFKELIDDAVKKNPPFDKTKEGKKSDAGYKDALIWKTILYSKEIDECEKLYFLSGDKVFEENKEYLSREFNNHHPNTTLKIVFFKPDGNQRQNSLQMIIKENHLLETEIIKLYSLDFILTYIKDIKYKYDEEVHYNENEKIRLVDIIFGDFTKEDFEINSVKYNENEYEVFVYFSTNKYKMEINEEVNKKILNGKIKFVFLKDKGEFKLLNHQLTNIEFQSTLIESFNNISRAITQIYSKKIIESMQKILLNIVDPLENLEKFNSIKTNFCKIIDTPTLEIEEGNNLERNCDKNNDKEGKKEN